ncbi:hypothetical protein AHAS_Ahas12G0121300 [Arachis hypogaea]
MQTLNSRPLSSIFYQSFMDFPHKIQLDTSKTFMVYAQLLGGKDPMKLPYGCLPSLSLLREEPRSSFIPYLVMLSPIRTCLGENFLINSCPKK